MVGLGLGLGGVELGVLAACVVLFVPLGMAGWHLSRNKVLFFGGALFITLAIAVHLTPYFSSVYDLINSVQSVVVLDSQEDTCISLVNEVVWDVKATNPNNHSPLFIEQNSYADNIDNTGFGNKNNDLVIDDKIWSWANTGKVKACEFQKLSKSDVSDLLNGSWITVAGDSQARLMVQSLLNLILDPYRMESVMGDLFKRHSDYKIVIDEIGMKLDFIWAPFVVNLTDLLTSFKQNKSYPDVLVMGAGLWHMLHVTNASDYAVALQSLRSSVLSVLPFSPKMGTDGPLADSPSVGFPHLFWLGMPMLINGMLNTKEKREKMIDEVWHAYDQVFHNSNLLRRYGGPFLLLDIESLSWNCGTRCTVDGMHYDKAVYEAAIHILLNALLIESHQKLGPS